MLALILAGSLGAVNAKKSHAEGDRQGEVHTEAAETFKAIPSTFLDVGAECSPLTAKWNKKAGLKKSGLILEKGCTTGTSAAAGADIDGEHGIVLTQLGFDYNGYCEAGAPRFNVYTEAFTAGYFVGCASGTHTDLGNGWTRVRFREEDFLPFGGAEPFRYSNTVVDEMEIILDEEGRVVLDNIAINSYQIDKK